MTLGEEATQGVQKKKRGRKARPIGSVVKLAKDGSRRVRRYDDEEKRDRALDTMRRAGEIEDGRPWHSFDETMNGYLEENGVASKRYEGDTFDVRAKTMRQELIPVFGGKSIRAVTPIALDQVRSDVIARRGRHAWNPVRSSVARLVKYAISEGWLLPAEDPFIELTTYRTPLSKTVMKQLAAVVELPLPTLAQIQLMLQSADGWLKLALGLVLLAGLRTGEIRALRWRHVLLDRENRIAIIVVEIAMKHDGTEGPPKSKAGEREVPIRGPFFDLLESLHPGKKRAGEHVVLLPDETSPGGVRPMRADEFYYHLTVFQFRIGIGSRQFINQNYIYQGVYGPHMLRHAAVAWWIWRGVPDALIQYWVGHANIKTTLETYGYLLEAHERGDGIWSTGPMPSDDEEDQDEFDQGEGES